MRGAAIGCLLAVLLASAGASAEGIVAGPCSGDQWRCRRAGVSFSKEDAQPYEWQFDSGWIPPSSDLQVHLWGAVYASTRVELSGDLRVSWPQALAIETPGHDGGGLLGYHYGVDAGAEGKVHLVIANQTYDWQGALPYVPQVDFQVEAEETFDSWGWPPGIEVSDSSQPQRVAQIDIAGLIGPTIPGVSGGFELDIALDLTVSYVNERIVIERPDGQVVAGGQVVAADDSSSDDYHGGAYVELDVHPEGRVRHEGVLHLIPAFYISVLGNNTSIPIADIPVTLPPDEQTWVFDAERVHVPLPDLEVDGAFIDFGEVSLGNEVEHDVELADLGEADVRLLTNTSDPEHFVPGDLAVVIQAGESAKTSVRFSPSEARTYLAVLELESNDPDAETQLVLMRGVGIDGDSPITPAPGIDASGGCACAQVAAPHPSEQAFLALTLTALVLVGGRRRRATARQPDDRW